MDNKYLEKIAEISRKEYLRRGAYANFNDPIYGASASKQSADFVATTAGTLGGYVAGHASFLASKPLAQRVARNVRDKEMLRRDKPVFSNGPNTALKHGARKLPDAIGKGIRAHWKTRAAATGAGFLLGGIPGSVASHNIRKGFADEQVAKYENSLQKSAESKRQKAYIHQGAMDSYSQENRLKALGLIGAQLGGAFAGYKGGRALSKPLAQSSARKAANKVFDKTENLQHAITMGGLAHSQTRMYGGMAGALVGMMPGSIAMHNAKSKFADERLKNAK